MKSKEFITEGSAEYNMLRQLSKAADAKSTAASDELNKFPKGPMGLTPDSVKSDPAWQKAKKEFDQAFAEMRHYNSLIMKNHKKEHKAARDAERASRYKVKEGDRIDELYSQGEVNGLEAELDKMFSTLGLDVEFTPHFVERLLGREKRVTMDELQDAFEKLKKKYKGKLLKAKKSDMGRATLQDLDQDLNIVFAIVPDKKNNEYDLVNITAMTKDPDQFHLKTSTPLKVGSKKPVQEDNALGELERDITMLWLDIEDTVNDRFEGGWATCTYACREVANLSKRHDMVVADGEYNGMAHWFAIVNTGDGKKIVDLGNNIDDKHMDSGTIEPMVVNYPDSRYTVDNTYSPEEWVANIYPEIKHF